MVNLDTKDTPTRKEASRAVKGVSWEKGGTGTGLKKKFLQISKETTPGIEGKRYPDFNRKSTVEQGGGWEMFVLTETGEKG